MQLSAPWCRSGTGSPLSLDPAFRFFEIRHGEDLQRVGQDGREELHRPCHPVDIGNHGDAREVAQVLEVELGVFPCSIAREGRIIIAHYEQQLELVVLFQLSFDVIPLNVVFSILSVVLTLVSFASLVKFLLLLHFFSFFSNLTLETTNKYLYIHSYIHMAKL